jgi:chemotaxis protein MotB
MRRRKDSHLKHERWILSYADFVTLLFALFVAMYAISQQDKSGAKVFSESVRQAVTSGGVPTAVRTLMATQDGNRPSPPPPQPPLPPNDNIQRVPIDPNLAKPFEQLSQALKDEIREGKVGLRLGTRGLVITLREQSFFPSGDDAIYASSYPAIERVATVIAKLPNPVRLEGHTDSVPIHTGRFRDNWELSTARSIALLQLFHGKFGIDEGRFAVAGYSQYAPVADNGTDDGKSRNRRVEIVILSR